MNSSGQKSKVGVDSGFLVDASRGGVVLTDGGMLVVVVFMCIKSVYDSYNTINTTINTIMYWWKFEEKKRARTVRVEPAMGTEVTKKT